MDKLFYFKINLNKYGDLKLQTERENKVFYQAIAFFLLGMVIVLGIHFYNNSKLKAKVNNRAQYLRNTEHELTKYQASDDYLSSQDLDRLEQTFSNRIFWANKLVALSQEIDSKLAVRKFTYQNGILTLNGITPIDNNVREIDLVNEFVMRLKSNPEISNDFPEIKIGPINTQEVKDTKIMEFIIECYSKDSQTVLKGGIQ